MDILMALIMIIAGFFFLVKGADLFVDSASGIAGKLGISPVVIGLTIVAFGTSMPELAVSVTAALEGANEIALGNVVGSNIFNLLVVAGGSACLYPLACDRILLKRDWPLSALAALVLGIFLFGDQRISRGEALILLAMFGAVLFMQLKGAKQTEEKAPETRPMGRLLLFLVIGITAIVIGGQITVDGATSLARILGLSETLIGLTIVAVGTSLPELFTSLVAARKGENEIAMGNVDAFIPDSYISNEYQKLDIYKRIAGIENQQDYDDMLEELLDRFGEMPKAVLNLLAIARIKALAHRAYVAEIKQMGADLKITLYEKARLDPAGIPVLLQKYRRGLQFKAEQEPKFLFTPVGKPLEALTDFLKELEKLAEE